MPTVIDSLIVRLGLDPKGVAKQGAPVTKQLNSIEKQGDRSTKSVDNLTGSLAKFLALIGSTLAIRAFVEDTIGATAAIDRLSKNLNLGAGDITAWGNAAEELGGSAKGLQGSLSMLSREQTNLRVKGESSLLPYFSMLKVNLTGVGLAARPTTDILLDLAGAMSHYDRQTGHNILADMGFDEGTINLMLQGRKELELTLQRQKDYGAQVAKFAPEASKLQRELVDTKQGFTLLGLTLLTEAAPALEKVFGWFQKVGEWARDNSQFVGDFLTVIGAGLGAIGIAALPIDGVVVAITALSTALVLLYQDYQTWKRGGDSFIDWQVWKDRVDAVTNGIKTLRGEIDGLEKTATAFLNKTLPGFAKFDDWFTHKWVAQKGKSDGASAAGSVIGKALGIRGGSSTPQQAIAKIEGFYAKGDKTNRPQRNHNPGDIEYGDFAKAHGATGTDGRFAIFPDDATGFNALTELLKSPAYAGLSVEQMITKFAPPKENDTAKYIRDFTKATGSKPTDNVGQMLAGIQGASSTVAAAGGPVSPASSSNDNSVTNHVGEIKVYTTATDANGIARDLNRSMDFLFTSQANSGLF